MEILQNFIGGMYSDPLKGQYLDNYEPGRGVVFAQTPDSTPEDLALAIEAASKAFKEWSYMSIDERSSILIRLGDLIEKNLDELSAAESKDTGKPLSLARKMDIPRAAANFRFYGSAIVNFSSESHLTEGIMVNYTRRAPLGLVGCISPWNLPLYLLSWKIAPALAMGNCVLSKPSELSPLTASMLGKLANEAGVPPGVLNILHGRGSSIGQAIVESEHVKAISFTGGSRTGKTIGTIAAQNFKKQSLELGGKNPNIVFADCSLEEAVSESVKSAFTNQGEICLCGSKILIEEPIYDHFKKQFLEECSGLKVGEPADRQTDIGALISKSHLDKVRSYVGIAREEGGKILLGGNGIDQPGYYFEPTVIEGLDENSSLNQEEIFGPVVTLDKFYTEAQAIERANSTRYGLSCTIWTSDIKRAHRVAHAVEAGIVWVNCWLLRDLRTPFGGMKESGVGREGGNKALMFFSELQNICIKL